MTSQLLRRAPLALSCAGLLLAAILSGEPLQGPIRVVPVAGSVSTLISGRGGNIGVSVGEDGVLLVDSLFERDVEAVREALGELSEQEPVFLLNTHVHGDHTGGNDSFASSATIVAHANVRRRLLGEERPKAALPVITYDDGVTLHFNGEDIVLLHVDPAHTDGDSVVWFKGSNVVHMGDLYFNGKYPFIDLDRGGDVEGYLAGLRRVLELVPADARIIPGHGEVSGVPALRENLRVLEEIVGRFREVVAEGMSEDEILALHLTEDFDGTWGTGFMDPERFARIVIRSLSR